MKNNPYIEGSLASDFFSSASLIRNSAVAGDIFWMRSLTDFSLNITSGLSDDQPDRTFLDHSSHTLFSVWRMSTLTPVLF